LIRLPPPVDLGLFTPRTDTAPHPPRCIAAGRFVAQKGFRCLLRAWYLMMTQWPASAPQPELVLVGDGPERRRLEAMVAALPQPSTVRFTGPLARSAVVAQLQASDVFALPVRTRLYGLNPEGLGLGFLEAAACGLAVIAGRSGGAPETVLDGRSGYVVHPDDVSTIAHRLTQLLSDRSSSRRMGEVGRMHISARYGSSAVRRTLRTALEL
jgi:phosphatidylinositol alpha-1,6-mannosyltransferase